MVIDLNPINWSAPLLSIGEVMIEFAPDLCQNSKRLSYSLSFGGDTFNTAILLSRLGVKTSFYSNLGDDDKSHSILKMMRDEGVDPSLVKLFPGRAPGLYLIKNHENGERSFSYWRKEAPAREMFSSTDEISIFLPKLARFKSIYVTGITLAILEQESRYRLITLLSECRKAGATIVMDSNYRSKLWKDKQSASDTILELAKVCDVSLVSLDDERELWGADITAEKVIEQYHLSGVKEIIVKSKDNPILVSNSDSFHEVSLKSLREVVDSTGAGDAFNAGYILARIKQLDLISSVNMGCAAAGAALEHRGALGEREAYLERVKSIYESIK